MSGTENGEYVGAILAAGRGSRMSVFSEQYPKPLIPICNRPVIQHQIELMRDLGIRDIYVLIGHKGYEITRRFGNGESLGVRLHYVEQKSILGIAHAVGHLESCCDRPFLLFLGDIFFVPSNLSEMLALFEGGTVAVLATKTENDPAAIRRNFSVTVTENNVVTRVIEKPRYTTNRLKGVGIYLFDPVIFDAIRRTPRTAMRDEYEITESIQVLVNDGMVVKTANVVLEDVNLTAPEDVLWVNLRFAAKYGPMPMVSPDSHCHPGALIENSVIGPGVTIEHPVRISNSVIFEGTNFRGSQDLNHTVVTPYATVNCGLPQIEARN